ncbi:MAG: sensor histidine kinase [Tepidisphaerales bacterium]
MVFLSGFFTGIVAGSALAAVVAWVAYRRILRLRVRAKQAERLAELGTLTGGLAHEIKNPLSTLHLNLQLAREDLPRGDPSAARLNNRLELCEREASRLRDILDDFMRYAGKIELDRKPLALNRTCEDLVDFFYPQAQLQKVQLRLRKCEQEITVPADERQIKQAVLNLMLNGMQAMPNGGDMILAVSANPREATIDIIDTGTGIPAEAAARIFDAYYSTKKGGTGLGLAMTRRIIEEHGGTVTVTSEPGKGSDFAIRLPRT